VPEARGAGCVIAFLSNTARPQAASICTRVMCPGRSNTGSPRVQSMMVDSMPTSHSPPSRINKSSPSSDCTCAAVVGLTRPKRLALGADTPCTPEASAARSSTCATGCEGQRKPIESCPPAEAVATPLWRGRIKVKGPGQKASIKACAKSGTCAAKIGTCAALATCTIKGWSAGRPLASKIWATAASSVALAARP